MSPFGDLLRRCVDDPARPWLTDIDLSTGTRSELSVTSAVNGVAKVAHLVGGVAAADPLEPTRIELRLPLHWQTVTLLLGCWWAGAIVLAGGGPATASPTAPADTCGFTAEPDVVVLGPDQASDPGPESAEVVWGTRLHPLGLGFDPPPPFPVEDLSVLLRTQPDQPPQERSAAAGPVAELGGAPVSSIALAARAAELAGLAGESGRLLVTGDWWGSLDVLAAATAAPCGGARSVVLMRGAHPDRAGMGELVRVCEVEQVTASVGLDVEGVPRLA